MTDSPVDPRVVRTKQRLFDALLDMIQVRRWDKIRVQDLLNETGISRSAFYAHFNNKYDLLTAGIPEFTMTFDGHEGTIDLLPLFAHVDEAAALLRPLMTQPVLSDIVDTFHRQIAASWTTYLAQGRHRDDPMLPEMLAGAVTSLIRSYALDKDREDPVAFSARVKNHLERLIA